jgi:hypothetical protein
MAKAPDHSAGKPHFHLKDLFAETNRGILLDILIFLANVFLMHSLTANFIQLADNADKGDMVAGAAIFLFCLGIYVLAPLGAVLKRPHFHRRLQKQGKTSPTGETFVWGCFFNPIFYFSLNLVIVSAINAFAIQFFYNGKDPGAAISVPMVIASFFITVIQTFLIYRYFSAPKRESKTAFFKSPWSETAGDVCLFLNMMLFQLIWNGIGQISFGPVAGIEDLLGRLFFISFIALLIYFPPRIFFLAEDIRRPITWVTILLANSPVIFRVLFGTATQLQN